jgi:hypothetical protein
LGNFGCFCMEYCRGLLIQVCLWFTMFIKSKLVYYSKIVLFYTNLAYFNINCNMLQATTPLFLEFSRNYHGPGDNFYRYVPGCSISWDKLHLSRSICHKQRRTGIKRPLRHSIQKNPKGPFFDILYGRLKSHCHYGQSAPGHILLYKISPNLWKIEKQQKCQMLDHFRIFFKTCVLTGTVSISCSILSHMFALIWVVFAMVTCVN